MEVEAVAAVEATVDVEAVRGIRVVEVNAEAGVELFGEETRVALLKGDAVRWVEGGW